jgi:CheY-like chemotaxis protein
VPRILVADDNTNIQKMVALAFEERGIDVVSVGNGEAAVRRIPDLAPDLVLADVFMPVRNGYEVCEFVKKDDRFSHVPVILLVGAFDPLDEKEARRVGADGVLKKPFIPPDPLIAMVTSALEKNPKLAAEMAKAREVPEAAPEPAAPVVETPARVESKPLPEFPEPTPEEAAAIYGFGKGRTTDNEEPAPPKEELEPEEEEFDGSSTTSDWRRNAANFEVPAEIGPFTPGESFDSAIFPSERDVPPRHVPMPDEQAAESAEQISAYASEPAGGISAYASTPAEPPTTATVEEHGESKSEEVAAPVVKASAPVVEQTSEAKPALATEEQTPLKPKSNSWLDMFASPSEYGESGWISSIFGSKKKTEKEEPKIEETTEAPSTSEATSHAVVAAENVPAPAHAEEESPKAQAKPENADQIFAESAPATDSWLAPPPPPVLGGVAESAHLGPVGVSAEAPDDLLSAPADTPAVQKDPDLEEPVAPHVTPEPLLMDEEEPREASAFSGAPEPPEPLYQVLVPVPENPPDEPSDEDPAVHQALGGSIFAPPDVPPVMNPEDERIPTVPPPNREALADIPFLMPPPASTLESQAEPQAKHPEETPSSVDTDAIVAKLLDKLEPQLHEVLAKGLLKPLVENMLREELEKKTK